MPPAPNSQDLCKSLFIKAPSLIPPTLQLGIRCHHFLNANHNAPMRLLQSRPRTSPDPQLSPTKQSYHNKKRSEENGNQFAARIAAASGPELRSFLPPSFLSSSSSFFLRSASRWRS